MILTEFGVFLQEQAIMRGEALCYLTNFVLRSIIAACNIDIVLNS